MKIFVEATTFRFKIPEASENAFMMPLVSHNLHDAVGAMD